MSDWASFGDFIGGTINTILSLSSLIILGYLTKVLSNQSNEENKNLNILLRRMDSYEKLTDFLPYLNQVFRDLTKNLTYITFELRKSDENADSYIEEFKKKALFFSDLQVFLSTFGTRYGHLYKYDFNSVTYKNFYNSVQPTIDFFDQITLQLKRREPGFPVLDEEALKKFLSEFGTFVGELKKELK